MEEQTSLVDPLAQSSDKADAANIAILTKPSSEAPHKAAGFFSLCKELILRFNASEGLTRSQALAFIGILSLGPILLFALAALGFFIHDPLQAHEYVCRLVARILPGEQAADAANQLISQTHIAETAQTLMKGKWWAIVFGVASLLWAAIGLFMGAAEPMNVAWEVKETRNFFQIRLVCLGVFFGAGVLFLLSLLASSGPTLASSLHISWLGLPMPVPWWIDLIFWLLAIAVDAGMFAVIYRFLPNTRVTWKEALFGGAAAGFLWEIFKKGFAIYLAHFSNFNKLYGALGGAVLLVTWIWYSCIVLLIGAILCKMYHEHTYEGGIAQKSAS